MILYINYINDNIKYLILHDRFQLNKKSLLLEKMTKKIYELLIIILKL